MIPKYEDHVALWRDELKAWMPSSVFDAHVHLCPPEAMGAFSAARRREALATFDSFTWEQYSDLTSQLFSGKNVLGLFAFPLPLQEVDLDRANDYIIEIMRLDARVHGFLLADPEDPRPSIAAYERARKAGVPFIGVKPYSDLLGRSNFECTMPEFIPEGLLEFMDAEGLVMMLHTSGIGVGDAENRRYLRRVADQFPRIKIILAHMGRYVQTEQFFRFLDSGLLEDCPNLFLDISSASAPEIYERFLERKTLWPRLLFASDLPFGLITGVERWSATHGAIFVARDHYAWSDPQMELQ
ncbi:MAG: amidohydrolase family protein, partial [Lentisphaeria bacterium]|nr:amidohydrolase family protein [Lentisphaeria bacterium]